MKKLRLKGFLALVGLTVYLLLVAIGPRGLVLCLGLDGHVRLEEATSGKICYDRVSSDNLDEFLLSYEQASSVHTDPCRMCTDIILSVEDWQLSETPRTITPSLLILTPQSLDCFNVAPLSNGDLTLVSFHKILPNSINPVKLSLKSTVLII